MNINIVNHSTGSHFDEIQASLVASLIGHVTVSFSTTPKETGINLVLGANVPVMHGQRLAYPPNTIIYNLEQLGHNSLWDSTFYMDYLLAYPVIDYSPANVQYLRKNGKNNNIFFLPIRHSDSFNCGVPKRKVKDIDVVIIGAKSPRREHIVRELQRLGVVVAYATDCWGEHRKALLSKAKLVLNVRANATGLLETTRLVSLISSGVFCISESSQDIDEDAYFSRFIHLTTYEKIVETTLSILDGSNSLGNTPLEPTSLYFSDTFDNKLSEILSDLLSCVETDRKKDDPKLDVSDLICRGFYLTARKKILSSRNSRLKSLLPAIDYILSLHDRIHDVVDVLLLDEPITSERLTIYCDMILQKWLPDEIKAAIKEKIWHEVRSKPRAELQKFEYTTKRLMAVLSDDNEAYLFAKIIPPSHALLDYTISQLNKISASRVIWDDIVRIIKSSNILPVEIAQHICAEIFWNIERSSDARDSYRQATMYSQLTNDHYLKVADRLKKFGDFITAQTYFEKAGFAVDLNTIAKIQYQSNNSNCAGIDAPDISKLAYALERSTSSKVFVKQATHRDVPSIHVGGILAGIVPEPIFDGTVQIYDKRLPRLVAGHAKAVGIIACYNEIDVIEHAIRSMIDNKIEVYVIDNWSNDGTYELLELLSEELQIRIERFPADGPSPIYDWTALLARKEEVALEYSGYWVIHGDADEIRISPWEGMDLATAFQIADQYGSNAIDYLILNFRPIDEGFTAGIDPEQYFNFFEVASSSDLRYQIKTWKQSNVRVDLVGRGGHFVQFEGRKVFPYKFICKHYPLRSSAHAGKKINFDRKARFSPEERARGWHSHYDNVVPTNIQSDWQKLLRWNEDTLNILTPLLIHGT